MNKDLANLVLSGLVERATLNRKETFVSEAELQAIRVVIGQEADVPVSVESITIEPEELGPAKFEPNVKWLPETLSDNETSPLFRMI